MLRKLRYFVVVLGLALPALAVDGPGSISGYVRSSAGVPQMGAVVEVLSIAAQNLKVFTDDRGFYSISNLVPGLIPSKLPLLLFCLHCGIALVCVRVRRWSLTSR